MSIVRTVVKNLLNGKEDNNVNTEYLKKRIYEPGLYKEAKEAIDRLFDDSERHIFQDELKGEY